jgi:hypothetical protein
MCFSATASFISFGITGIVGVATVARSAKGRDLAFAAVPLFFAVQQFVEGALWLNLPFAPDAVSAFSLTYVFVLMAKVFWPAYAPLAVYLMEPPGNRRRWITACVVAGFAAALYYFAALLETPPEASIQSGHIVYSAATTQLGLYGLAYLAGTCIAPLLSSHRIIVLFGAVVIAGSAITYFFYWEAFTSVWCFFAAAASIVILVHFERIRRKFPVHV